MDIVKLTPPAKGYIWGGNRLRGYGVVSADAVIAEAWVLSFHKDGESRLADGRALSAVATRADWGTACNRFGDFPVLVKLIDAADDLSVQVHPSDAYASAHEGQPGKTEMWYVIDALPGAALYVGFKRDVTRAAYERSIKTDTLLSLLNTYKVKKGDCYFIPAGTVHAIGKGCLIAEVQQSSNLTYRVFDYNRTGADGKPRELHIQKALAVTTLTRYLPQRAAGAVLADCDYFTAALASGAVTVGRGDSFTGVLVTEGEGTLNGEAIRPGDSYFIPAGRRADIKGGATVLLTYVK
ncbi:MAG: class I mannose-6-phosphate isomerase [Clostridiales bacterium]|jgi:mannose-6-phosphate isomerase|nr:class I mannose-6-phosphate isomerase [Clostridiales bacterium]